MNQNNQIKAPHFLYRLLSPVWFLFWLIHTFLHAYKFKEWRYVPQRLGFFPPINKQCIWIHAASVGEVNLIKPLCDQLISQGHIITVSTFTATGFQRANTLFSNQMQVIALPIDFWPISWLFAKRINAQCALIAETELWPETLYQIAKNRIPLIQVNARLSNKSLKSVPAIKSLLKRTLSYFDEHLTRYDEDVANFIAMGVNKDKVKVLGNLKYSQNLSAQTYPNIIQQPYILFASTHHNEEEQFASLRFDSNIELPLIVIAPRHPTRLDSILKSLLNHGIKSHQIAIRSKNEPITSVTKIYLSDTLGEMNSLFQHALIVIMGGSFVEVGGHNILEPAALKACIITGPSDSNIKQDIIDLKRQQAVIQVDSLEQLKHEITLLLSSPENRKQFGSNAALFVNNAQDVLKNYVAEISKFIH